MLEKWVLVVVIVGCTSLIFLICFPIDFYLYRRRKRLARKRGSSAPFYPRQDKVRAPQMHSRVSLTTSTCSVMGEDQEQPVSSATKNWVVRSKLARLVSLFRKQKKQKLLQLRHMSVSTTSEIRSDVPRVAVTLEPQPHGVEIDKADAVSPSTCNTGDELLTSRSSIDRHDKSGNAQNAQSITSTRFCKTVANIESHTIKENVSDSLGYVHVDGDSRNANMNFGLEKQIEDKFYGLNKLSVSPKEARRLNIDIEDCIGPENYRLNLSAADSALNESSDELTRDEKENVELHTSNLEILQVKSQPSDQDTLDSGYDRPGYRIINFKSSNSKTTETTNGLPETDDHAMNRRFRKLSSEPNLKITNNDNTRNDSAFDPLSMSFSEGRLDKDLSQHRLKSENDTIKKDVIREQEEDASDSNTAENGKREKRKPKLLGISDDGVTKPNIKKRKKKAFLQKLAATSLPEISIDDNLSRESDL